MTMRIALTIAGSDSGGGAGIQADLKTFHQFGVYGTSVLVAITAQNTRGVRAVHDIPGEVVSAQLAALAEDLPPSAVKTGMLSSAALASLVASAIRANGWSNYVLDPVMVATSGDRLLSPDAEATVREALLPLAAIVTPNLDEAAILCGFPVATPADMEKAGAHLIARGASAALLKGGHLAGDELVDVLVTPDGVRRFPHRRIATTSNHGTGCTLSAALTACLALGLPLEESVARSLDYLQRAIASAPGLGSGHGPVNHAIDAMTPSMSLPTRSPT
jgi:hydroxymethylpyrimidine/phosphomethylpyrimidine kinase